MNSTAPAEEQRQPKVVSKVIEGSFASIAILLEMSIAESLSDAAKGFHLPHIISFNRFLANAISCAWKRAASPR